MQDRKYHKQGFKCVGFILDLEPTLKSKYGYKKKNSFEPYTTGEFLNYPHTIYWKPVYIEREIKNKKEIHLYENGIFKCTETVIEYND